MKYMLDRGWKNVRLLIIDFGEQQKHSTLIIFDYFVRVRLDKLYNYLSSKVLKDVGIFGYANWIWKVQVFRRHEQNLLED